MDPPTAAQDSRFKGLLANLERTPPEALAKLDRSARAQPISLRLAPDDVARAKALAEKKGIGYQTLLTMVIHEGLALMAAQ